MHAMRMRGGRRAIRHSCSSRILQRTPESASLRAGQLGTHLPPRDARRNEAVRDAHAKARVSEHGMLPLIHTLRCASTQLTIMCSLCLPTLPPDSASCLLPPPPLFL